MVRLSIVLAVLIALVACSPDIVRNAPPADRMTDAAIPGMPGVRFWRARVPEGLPAWVEEIRAQRRTAGIGNNITLLALSGGADDGAFGAGLMAAWSARGDRPEFHVVTGVSTGALSAPFVFLGPDWDDELKEVYGGLRPEEIFRIRSLIDILPSASAADSGPLAEVIARYVDADFIALVAREHRRGRRLYIQTTNLDAQEAMIWDMGAIALSGSPDALELFRKVLLASASVPGAFAPVLIQVELNGKRYDEMHVDGGVISESTVLADWQPDLSRLARHRRGSKITYYVIRNGRVSPERKQVEYSLIKIAGRAVSTLIKSQGVDDLLTAYSAAKESGAGYYVTWIGEDFDAPYPGPFDPGYMQALYQYGYDLLASDRAWETIPPQLMNTEERERALRHAR